MPKDWSFPRTWPYPWNCFDEVQPVHQIVTFREINGNLKADNLAQIIWFQNSFKKSYNFCQHFKYWFKLQAAAVRLQVKQDKTNSAKY